MNNSTIEFYREQVVARWYDKLYSHESDISFYIKELTKHNKESSVLIIGCGTGRLLIPLVENGYNVTGIDSSIEMIHIVKNKLSSRSLISEIEIGDMRNFVLSCKYDIIIIPFRTYSYNLTQECQIKTLITASKHLSENGILMLDLTYPVPENLLKYVNKKRLARMFYMDGQLVEYFENTTVDYYNQIMTIETEFYLDSKRLMLTNNIRLTKYIYPSELILLAKITGYQNIEIIEGFSGNKLSSNSANMVVKLWK